MTHRIFLVFAATTTLAAASCADSPDGTSSSSPAYAARETAPAEFTPPTAEQLSDLAAAVENPGTAADNRLKIAMTLADNEGLALALVREARRLYEADDRTNGLRNLLFFLSCRSGETDLLIDGPYLKEYAELLLMMVERELAQTEGSDLQTRFDPLLNYLRAHPEDQDLRKRTLAVALRHIKVVSTYRSDEEISGDWQADWRAIRQFEFSREVLLQLGVFSDGMDFAEASEVLGEPTYRHNDRVGWRLRVRTRIKFGIAFTVEGEKLKLSSGL